MVAAPESVAGGSDRPDDVELDVLARRHRIEEALAHIFAEQLPRQESVRQAFMQAGMIFALIEQAESPIQKVARLTRPHRQIAGAHIEQVQGWWPPKATPCPSVAAGSTMVRRKGSAMRARQAMAAATPVKPPPTMQICNDEFRT